MTKFSHMTMLKLESSRISEFDYGSISAWPELTNLYLGSNNISSLPDINDQHENCSMMHRQKYVLILSPNPVDCDSRAANIIVQQVHLDVGVATRNCYI